MRKRFGFFLLGALLLTGAVTAPFRIEEIRIGNGPTDTLDGGADIDSSGNIETSGTLEVGNTSTLVAVYADTVNTAGLIDAATTIDAGTGFRLNGVPLKLSHLDDVDLTGLVTNDLIGWDGTDFVPFTLGSVSLPVPSGDGQFPHWDVGTSAWIVSGTPSSGQVPQWNGSQWVPTTPSSSVPSGTTQDAMLAWNTGTTAYIERTNVKATSTGLSVGASASIASASGDGIFHDITLTDDLTTLDDVTATGTLTGYDLIVGGIDNGSSGEWNYSNGLVNDVESTFNDDVTINDSDTTIHNGTFQIDGTGMDKEWSEWIPGDAFTTGTSTGPTEVNPGVYARVFASTGFPFTQTTLPVKRNFGTGPRLTYRLYWSINNNTAAAAVTWKVRGRYYGTGSDITNGAGADSGDFTITTTLNSNNLMYVTEIELQPTTATAAQAVLVYISRRSDEATDTYSGSVYLHGVYVEVDKD